MTQPGLFAGTQASVRSGSRSFLILFPLGHLANDWAPSAIWLLAPAIAAAMGLSPAEVGLLITVYSIGAALGYIPAGILADHVANRARLLQATFWWVAVGFAVASLAPNYWSLALLLAVAGMGDAAWHPIATGVMVQSIPGRRAQALGIHAMGGTLAEVLAPLAVGFLLVHFDWRTTLQLSALPAVAMGLCFLVLVRRIPPSPEGAMSWSDLRDVFAAWRGPAGTKMVLLLSLYNMSLMALMAMTPLFLQQVHGFSSAVTGGVFAGVMLAGALSQPLVGRLSDRIGRRPVILSGTLFAGVGALLLASGPAVPWLVGLLTLVFGLLVAIRSAVLAAAVEFAGRRAGTTLGLTFVLLDGVGALGSVLAGLVGSLDLHFAFLAAGLLALAAFAVGLTIRLTPVEGPTA